MIENLVGHWQLDEPPLMPKEDRLTFLWNLTRNVLEGGDRGMCREFAELEGLNRVAVSNLLRGLGSLGYWGEDDAIRRINEWLATQNIREGRNHDSQGH